MLLYTLRDCKVKKQLSFERNVVFEALKFATMSPVPE